MVRLHEVGSPAIGQTTPTFLSYRLPMLEHLSFSLVRTEAISAGSIFSRRLAPEFPQSKKTGTSLH